MIELTNLQKRYGARVALDLPSLRVPEGELLAIIGPNGSGKSTLLRLLSGVIEPDAGTIHMDAVHRGDIGYLPQQPYAFDLSVLRNVELALEGEQEHARQLEIEFGQLQLELSTWATHPRIEKIAKERLKMRVPEAKAVIAAVPREVKP